MSLNNEEVCLYISRDPYDADAELETTIGELVDACHSKRCPMGMFSCPILDRFGCACEKVTAQMWGRIFGIYERDPEE